MSDLLVPITLEVLLANQILRDRDTFRLWRHAYTALQGFGSPEPLAFDCNMDDDRTGAILHWTLPRSLRSSVEGNSSAFPLVPNRWLVTRGAGNEDQKVLKSWVIESDCPQGTADGASYYLVAREVLLNWQKSPIGSRREQWAQYVGPLQHIEGGAYPVNLGVATDLADWEEQMLPQKPTNLFLTAVAPGNLEFSAYVPFNEGIFSFFDELKDVAEATTLSYQVTGWYSDPAQDIVATVPLPAAAAPLAAAGKTPAPRLAAQVLAALNWTLPQNAPLPEAFTSSFYSGTATGLRWNPNEEAIADSKRDQLEHARASPNMTVAIANTSVDAFSTLVGTQLDSSHGYDDPAKVVELLRAFHYDLLPLLNQPNGEVLLNERVRQEWFSSRAGGTQWAIVADKAGAAVGTGTAAPPETPPLTAAQSAWLLQLNQDQQALDEAVATLTSLQWNLNAAWWRKNYLSAAALPGKTPLAGKLKKGLDTDYDKSLDAVLEQLKHINNDLLGKVPQSAGDGSTSQTSFLEAIDAFARAMPEDAPKAADPAKPVAPKKLKAVAQPRFWLPGNPNVLVSHVTPSEIANPDSRVTVRSLPSHPAAANGKNPPAGVLALQDEFFRLDPTTAATTATPDWTHEWNPIYLEWEVMYTAVPVEANGITNWCFDGTDYVLVAAEGRPLTPQPLSGRSLLSPNAQLTFKSRLQKFLTHYGDSENISGKELKSLYEEIAAIDDWAFLSQELTGFNELLTQRDTRTFRTPAPTDMGQSGDEYLPLAHLIGYPPATGIAQYNTPTQAQGLVNSVPAIALGADDAGAFPFQGIRSGQLYLNHLILYDKFGRQLDLVMPDSAGVLDANVFPLVRDAALLPTYNLSHRIAAPVQLPPRLLQPARLDLLLVDHRNPQQVLGQEPDVNPVCGWLIANHLDQSILVFAPDGSSAGEMSLDLNKEVQWTPPPHSTLLKVDDIAKQAQAPQLRDFVAAAKKAKTEAAFQALLQVIDSTLWSTDPLGDRTDANLTVFVGRPLALVAVRVQFSLCGPALTSCDGVRNWNAKAMPPAFTKTKFSIRFGNLESREDGVIGYFKAGDYDTFNSVVAPSTDAPAPGTPQPPQCYVREIGPLKQANGQGNYIDLAFDGQAQLITLLVDPRATVHATTGILPVKTLTLPKQFVDKPLACMEINFKMGPLLSRIKLVAEPKIKPAAELKAAKALSFLPISEKNGTWSWWEKVLSPTDSSAGSSWCGYELTDATTTAALGSPPATLREGYLQFLAEPESEPEPEPEQK